MGEASLVVELEREDGVFRIGERVRGRVVVTTEGRFVTDRLVVGCRWTVQGSGNVEHGPLEAKRLRRVECKEGDPPVVVPFDLPAPNGPLTFRGQHVHLDWEVIAHAEVPWASDPVAARRFTLSAPASEQRALGPGDYRAPPTTPPLAIDFGPCWRAPAPVERNAAAAKSSAVGSFLGAGVTGAIAGGLVAGSAVPWAVLFGIGTVLLFAHAMTSIVTQARLGDRRVLLEPPMVRRGDAVLVTVELHPTAPIEEAWIELSGAERAIEGSGSNKRQHERSLHRERVMPDKRATRDGIVLTARLKVPAEALPTFIGRENEIRWQARTHVPGWDEVLDVTVTP